MMIAICGDCGWLGGPPDLVMTKGVSENLIEELGPFMIGNRDASYLCCPSCTKSRIFYKNLQGGDVPKPLFMNNAQTVVVPAATATVATSTSAIEPTIEVAESTPVLKQAQAVATVIEGELDPSVPPFPDEFIPPPEVDSRGRPLKPGFVPVTDKAHTAALFRCYCDECGNDFETKVERSTRCDKCLRKLTGKR
ncbi:hypothetical protein KAR91_50125 [Candidatus Pacearchaeota archaeon]|nr:hypothetical protein [Candidatus Pacearchaeota archaeon]